MSEMGEWPKPFANTFLHGITVPKSTLCILQVSLTTTDTDRTFSSTMARKTPKSLR